MEWFDLQRTQHCLVRIRIGLTLIIKFVQLNFLLYLFSLNLVWYLIFIVTLMWIKYYVFVYQWHWRYKKIQFFKNKICNFCNIFFHFLSSRSVYRKSTSLSTCCSLKSSLSTFLLHPQSNIAAFKGVFVNGIVILTNFERQLMASSRVLWKRQEI